MSIWQQPYIHQCTKPQLNISHSDIEIIYRSISECLIKWWTLKHHGMKLWNPLYHVVHPDCAISTFKCNFKLFSCLDFFIFCLQFFFHLMFPNQHNALNDIKCIVLITCISLYNFGNKLFSLSFIVIVITSHCYRLVQFGRRSYCDIFEILHRYLD